MDDRPLMFDEGETLSYGGLLEYANARKAERPVLKPRGISDFLKSFISSVANGEDVTLLDAGMTEAEISATGVPDPDKTWPAGKSRAFESAGELVGAFMESPSRISLFTSGTSGAPKMVSHTVRSLSRGLRRGAKHAGDVWGFAHSPTHMAGLQVLIQILANENRAANLFRKPEAFISDAFDSFGITHISASPTFYRMLLASGRAHPSVRRVTLGGERSGRGLHAALLGIFPNARINNVYASTECGSLLCSSGEFFFVPEDLRGLIKIDGRELLVHSSLLGASSGLEADGGFYRTGDMVEWEPGGARFRFVSREGSSANVGGYKVDMEEVEDAIRRMPEVSDAAVRAVKNSVTGAMLCADVKPAPGARVDIPGLRAFLAKSLQPFKIPRIIRFVDEIESTGTGKKKRR